MENLNKVIEIALRENEIPYAAYGVTNKNQTLASGSIGHTDLQKINSLNPNSIFRIASMTKPLTSTALMLLAREKNINLETPVENYLAEFKNIKVAKLIDGEIFYSKPETKITLHQLLTHTSGFGYDFHHETLSHLLVNKKIAGLADKEGKFLNTPLVEQPGKYWHYGIGLGWIGKFIEKLSETSLNDFMTKKIFTPLGMKDTSFDVSLLGEHRLPSVFLKKERASLVDISEHMPSPQMNEFAYGGGGLFSTPKDYLKFIRLFLNGGKVDGIQFLPEEIIMKMTSNQIGDLDVPFQPTFNSTLCAPNEWFPGVKKKWGYGFMINTADIPGRRSNSSCAWSGILNTFFWFDLKKGIGGTIMMQMYPCYHEDTKKIFKKFEEHIYSSI